MKRLVLRYDYNNSVIANCPYCGNKVSWDSVWASNIDETVYYCHTSKANRFKAMHDATVVNNKPFVVVSIPKPLDLVAQRYR